MLTKINHTGYFNISKWKQNRQKNHMHLKKNHIAGSHLGLKKTKNAMQKTGRRKPKLYHYTKC